ncbi:hypothetical protein [Ureaplasma urealyticum]|uniref:hypothetical protein n=2 Tax=Ureaplasma urealyticum TaxID=2130 RepID=UPI001E4C71EC|nr:hypothetical protein [Ureaplasma urealyticum]
MSSILVGGIFMSALTGCKKEINLNDKIIVENVALVDQDVQAKKAKIKLTFAQPIVLENKAQASLKLTLNKKGTQQTKVVDLVLSDDKLKATTENLVEFATDVYNVTKLSLNNTEANVNSIKSSDLKIDVVSSVALVDQDVQAKKAKIKLTFAQPIVLENKAQASLKLTLNKKGTQQTKVVDLVLSDDKLKATTENLVEFATDVYNVTKLSLNNTEANVNSIKSSDLKIDVVSSVALVDQDVQAKKAKIKLTFAQPIVLENKAQASLKLTLNKKGTQQTKVVDLVLSDDKLKATTENLVEFATDVYNVTKLSLNNTEANVNSIKSSDLKIKSSLEEEINSLIIKKDIIDGIKNPDFITLDDIRYYLNHSFRYLRLSGLKNKLENSINDNYSSGRYISKLDDFIGTIDKNEEEHVLKLKFNHLISYILILIEDKDKDEDEKLMEKGLDLLKQYCILINSKHINKDKIKSFVIQLKDAIYDYCAKHNIFTKKIIENKIAFKYIDFKNTNNNEPNSFIGEFELEMGYNIKNGFREIKYQEYYDDGSKSIDYNDPIVLKLIFTNLDKSKISLDQYKNNLEEIRNNIEIIEIRKSQLEKSPQLYLNQRFKDKNYYLMTVAFNYRFMYFFDKLLNINSGIQLNDAIYPFNYSKVKKIQENKLQNKELKLSKEEEQLLEKYKILKQQITKISSEIVKSINIKNENGNNDKIEYLDLDEEFNMIPKPDEAIVSNIEFIEVNTKAKTGKIKLTFNAPVKLTNEDRKDLVLDLLRSGPHGNYHSESINLVLSKDKMSATANLSELREGIYEVVSLKLNGWDINLNNDIRNKKLKVETNPMR